MVAGDEWKALVLLAFAAEQGSPAAQHNLAFTLQRSKTFQSSSRQFQSLPTAPQLQLSQFLALYESSSPLLCLLP